MRIEHVAIWTNDIERLARFYACYFGAIPGLKYVNSARQFESQFLTFSSGARIELMRTTQWTPEALVPGAERMGLTHLAISTGSKQLVDKLSERLLAEGTPVLDGPRQTGDGYYECVVLDPDGNRIEVTA
jgi:lactoylglutathione lyase